MSVAFIVKILEKNLNFNLGLKCKLKTSLSQIFHTIRLKLFLLTMFSKTSFFVKFINVLIIKSKFFLNIIFTDF